MNAIAAYCSAAAAITREREISWKPMTAESGFAR